jgi:hypothetical protein
VLVQDTIATAAQLLHSVETRGKKVTAGNISYYAVRLTRQGRRSTGFKKTDPLHPAAQCGAIEIDRFGRILGRIAGRTAIRMQDFYRWHFGGSHGRASIFMASFAQLVPLIGEALRPGVFHQVKEPARIAVRSPAWPAGPMVLNPTGIIGLDKFDNGLA